MNLLPEDKPSDQCRLPGCNNCRLLDGPICPAHNSEVDDSLLAAFDTLAGEA